MFMPLKTSTLAISLALVGTTAAPVRAHSYPIDCAILLCLSGGWPASAPCARARAEFIRRITPFPVEPPLQIWRCPMGASFEREAPLSPMQRLYDITYRDPETPYQSVPGEPAYVIPAQAGERADIDISGAAFDFVRSIRVYHIQFRQRENQHGDCIRNDSTLLGSYGAQGEYGWTRSSHTVVPEASDLAVPSGCGDYFWRSVFVDWRDHAGNYGSEEVRY